MSEAERLLEATIQQTALNAEQIGRLIELQREHNDLQRAQDERLTRVCDEVHDVAVWQKVFLGFAGSVGLIWGVLKALVGG